MNLRINPYSTVKFKKDYQHHKVKFPVLTIDGLDRSKKDAIRAVIKALATADEAYELVFEKKGYEQGWQMEPIGYNGRTIGVLKRYGVEVAVFWPRQVTEVEPQPGEPAPEFELKIIGDLWQRLDILGPSAREANYFIKKRHDELEESKRLLEARVFALQAQVNHLETELLHANDTIERLRKKPKAKEKPDKKKIEFARRFKIAREKSALKKAKEEKKNARVAQRRQSKNKSSLATSKNFNGIGRKNRSSSKGTKKPKSNIRNSGR